MIRKINKINGILLLDKPSGLTSNKALQLTKKLFDAEKAGHTGTLDPTEGAYEVLVEGNHDNALAALSYNGNLLGAAYAENNSCIIILNQDVSNYEELVLTVTAYNTTTVIESVMTGESCPGYIAGDVTGDSQVNVVDVITLVNIVLDTVTPDNCQLEFGDLNSDNTMSIIDIILMVNIILDN